VATGIWLPDDVMRASAGQIWAQQQMQQLHAQAQAGQDWASQQMQRIQQQVAAQVQATAPPSPAPGAPTPAVGAPAPMPASVSSAPPFTPPPPAPPAPPPIPPPTPVTAPPPQPTTEAPAVPTPPTPAPGPTPDMLQAGQDWAAQQLQSLQAAPAPVATPQPTPAAQPAAGPAGAPTPSVGLPGAPAPPSAATSASVGSGAVPAGPQSSTPGDYVDQARQAAINAGIDPEIFSRQIQQESGFNPNAQSPAGALGIAQFMPSTAQGLGIDPMNAAQALVAAAQEDARRLQQYGGDWAKTLASYNAGPGAVAQYGGVPPYQETQDYVQRILGGAKDVVQNVAQGAQNAVQSVIQTGQTAVNTVAEGAQAAAARVSQFAMGLSSGDAMAFCGPAAAMAFAQTYGRNPTIDEAKQLAQQVGWNPSQGMAGVGSEVQLLNAMGVDAHATQGVDWSAVGRDASGGNPVIIDTPGHYYYVDGYNADTGQMHVGTSGTDLKGGSEWMTPEQINQMPQSQGAARSAIFADHPLAQQDGLAQSTAAGPTYMSTMQPAAASTSGTATSATTNLLDPWNLGGVSSAVQNKAQDVLGAVQNVGGGALNMAGNLPGAGLLPGLQPATQTLGAGLPDITNLLTVDPRTPLGRVVSGTPIGTLSPPDQAQALMQLNQQYEQARTAAVENLTGNLPVASGLANLATDPEQALALAGGGALGEALLPGAGALAGIGRQALTGALAGGVYGAGQPSATAQDILASTAAGGVLGGVAALPGVLRGLASTTTPEATQAVADLLAPETQFSPRGIAIDPLTGQEMVPAATATNNLTRAMAANPDATQFMRTAGNDFVPVMPQAPMASSDLLTGLQNMVGSRQQAVADTLQQLTDTVNQANAAEPSSDAQTALQGQIDGLRSRLQDLLTGRQATGPEAAAEDLTQPPPGAQLGQINAAFARALGGGALGGLTAYQTTDPNDPNRWLKVAGATGAGALAAGPYLESALSGGGVVPQNLLEQLRSANLNPNVYQPTARQGVLPQIADVTKQLILSNPATHVGNLIGNTLEILRSPVSLTLGGRPQDAVAGMTALGQAMPEAARNAWAALNGQQVATLGTAASQIPLSQPVYRALGAVDTFTRTLGEYQGMAERASQLLSRAGISPNDPAAAGVLNANLNDLLGAARAQGARSVFQPVRDATQGTSFLDNLAHTYSQYKEGLLNSPNLGSQALGTLLDFELPFAGIPMRLLEVGAGRAPGIAQVTGIGRALAAGQAGDMPAMQRAIGETALETGIQAMIAKGIVDGNIVGPDNPDHPGGAIQIGGQWFNFDRMAGGFALPMQIMAGFSEAFNKAGLTYVSPYANQSVGLGPVQVDRGALDRLAQQTAAGLNAAMKPFADAVPGEAIMHVLTAVGDGGTSQLIQQQAQDAIARVSQPGFARFLENLTDPVAREIQKTGPDALWQPTAAAIPGLSALLPPKIDPTTGQPMPRTSAGFGQLIGAENPHLSAITQEANDLRMKYGYRIPLPSAYPEKVTVGNSVIPLSPSEQQAVAQLSGQRMAQLTARIESPQYTAQPPLQRAMMLQGISRAADQLNVAALEQVLGPQTFRARVLQGLQLAGAPVVAQPQVFNLGATSSTSPALQAALSRALQGGGSGNLQQMMAANQAAAAYNAQQPA